LNLPNLLTLSRLAAIPALMVLLLLRFPYHDQIAAAVFLAASLTDTLDGQLARRRRQVTELGKFLDPLADKLFILSVLIVLVQRELLPAWVVLVVFGRELLITILRSVSASQGRVIAATPFGKTKTVTQIGAVLLVILAAPYPLLVPVAALAVAVAVAFTVVSGIDYLWRFRHVYTRHAGSAAGPRLVAVASGGAPGGDSPVHPLVSRLATELEAGGLTVATAESCTGGLIAAWLTDKPGSSAYFKGGVVAYTNAVKETMLGVPAAVIQANGAVSSDVAQAMAEGVRGRLHADIGLAATGIAGPEADGSGKPVGLTYVWMAGPGGGAGGGRRFVFSGDRWSNRRQAAEAALQLVLDELAAPSRAAGTT
jgi:CDP-diacylglycerol--glycerol-3-phosphate 3-phosphatidyltransferase